MDGIDAAAFGQASIDDLRQLGPPSGADATRFFDVRSSIDLLYSYMYIDIIYNKNKNLHVYIYGYMNNMFMYNSITWYF